MSNANKYVDASMKISEDGFGPVNIDESTRGNDMKLHEITLSPVII